VNLPNVAISIRNVQCDFYLAPLNGFDRPALLERHPQLSPKTRVPVIRIFGPLPTGSFICTFVVGKSPREFYRFERKTMFLA
jgi:hypothetical protein